MDFIGFVDGWRCRRTAAIGESVLNKQCSGYQKSHSRRCRTGRRECNSRSRCSHHCLRNLRPSRRLLREGAERQQLQFLVVGSQRAALLLLAVSGVFHRHLVQGRRGNCKGRILCRLQLGRVDGDCFPGIRRSRRRPRGQLCRQHCEELCHQHQHHSQPISERLAF